MSDLDEARRRWAQLRDAIHRQGYVLKEWWQACEHREEEDYLRLRAEYDQLTETIKDLSDDLFDARHEGEA